MGDEELSVQKTRPLRPVLNFERYWKLGLVAACLMFVLGLPLVWIKGQSQYAAEGVFQVFPTYQRNLQIDKELEIQSNAQYRDFVTQMMRTVVRRDIVEAMVNGLVETGTNLCRPAERFRRCVERMQRLIYVVPLADSYMVKVGFTASEKDLADQVVNRLLDEFIRKVRTEQIYGADERSSYLFEKKDSLGLEVEQLVKARNSLAQDLGLTTFHDAISNPFDYLLQQARDKHAISQSDLSAARSAQRAFKERGELPPSQGRSLLEMRYADGGLQTFRSEVIKRQEEIFKDIAGLRESHPMYAPMADQKSSMSSRLRAEEEAVRQDIARAVTDRLAAAIIQAELIEQDAKQRVASLEGKAEWFSAQFRTAQSLSREISLREKELDEIRDRMRYLESESRALGFVRVIAKALPADFPTGPGKSMLLAGLLAACCALFLTVPIVRGWLDPKVTDVVDVERSLKQKAAGWFVQAENSTTETIFSDQIRKFSGAIVRRHRSTGTQVFGVSSVAIGGGVTRLTRALANDLTRLGYRVVLIQQPGRSSSADGAGEKPGNSDQKVRGGSNDWTEVRHVEAMMDPSSRSFDFESFRRLIEEIKKDADFIFVEMPPFISSPDIDLIIHAVRDLLLIVEAMHIKKADLHKVSEKIAQISPDSVAVLVNKIPLEYVDNSLKRQFVERSVSRRVDEVLRNDMTLMIIRARISLWIIRLLDRFKNAKFFR